jgi:DNA-binding NtrC family response regulator
MTAWFEVLVVSSDAALRRRLTDILTSLGIDPVQLSTLRECRESLAQKHVGLVFCDPYVADGNYRDLLAAYPASADRPRVVITSRTADWDEFKEAMRCGAFDVIPVPCRHTDVEWMVVQAKRAERRGRPGLESLEVSNAASA